MQSTSPPEVSLHYEMIQTRGLRFEVATHGAGDRLALLLHGFPESAHSYRYQIPLLTQLGYRVWAPNLRGYGKSDKPRGRKAYAVDALNQDITDLIDESGARSVTLIGHDWGGNIAWSYAMHGARPLDRLVVLNCPHPVCFRKGLLTPAQLQRSWYMLLFQLPWLPERLIRKDDYATVERAVRGAAVCKDHIRDADLAVMRKCMSEPEALTSMLNYYRAIPWTVARMARTGPRKIRVPTLLIWGERDEALGVELTQGTEDWVSDLTRHYLPNASHWVQQDDPRGVNAALSEWLAEKAAA